MLAAVTGDTNVFYLLMLNILNSGLNVTLCQFVVVSFLISAAC